MANITNIKTRDGAVHPIALPFAVCETSADTSIKTLTFPGGDMPTALVNGQQLMVQFTNGNIVAASVTLAGKTCPLILNSATIVPYIGVDAVVNLTYNNNKFYLSNAAVLTGFKVPNDITLATIVNAGTIGNNGEATTGIQNIGNLYNITNADNGTIYKLNNTADIKTITNSKTITKIENVAGGSIGEITNSSTITNIYNNSGSGTISLFQNSNQVNRIENWGQVTNITNIGTHTISKIENRGTIGEPENHNQGIYNYGTVHYFTSNNIVSEIDNYGTFKTITNITGHTIEQLKNNGYIEQLENNGNIKMFTVSSTGSIGTSDDSANKFENKGQIYRIDNNKFIGRLWSPGTYDTAYGIFNSNGSTIGYESNDGYIPFLTNQSNGSIYRETNIGSITELLNNGTITSCTNGGIINSLDNTNTISSLNNTGTITSLNSTSGTINTATLSACLVTGNTILNINDLPISCGSIITGTCYTINPFNNLTYRGAWTCPTTEEMNSAYTIDGKYVVPLYIRISGGNDDDVELLYRGYGTSGYTGANRLFSKTLDNSWWCGDVTGNCGLFGFHFKSDRITQDIGVIQFVLLNDNFKESSPDRTICLAPQVRYVKTGIQAKSYYSVNFNMQQSECLLVTLVYKGGHLAVFTTQLGDPDDYLPQIS